MKLKPLALALVLAASAGGVLADDQSQSVTLIPDVNTAGSYSGAWSVTHTEAGAFTDTITFTDIDGFFSAGLVSVGFQDNSNIDFTSVSINGNAFTLSPTGAIETPYLEPTDLDGPLVLTVSGMAGAGLAAGEAISASYAGAASVSAVPEPEGYALMLAGLGAIGLLAHRRREQR